MKGRTGVTIAFDRPTAKPAGMTWERWRVIALAALIQAGEELVNLLEGRPQTAEIVPVRVPEDYLEPPLPREARTLPRGRGRPARTQREKAIAAVRARQLNAGTAYREAVRALAGVAGRGVRQRLKRDTAAALHRSEKTVEDMMVATRRKARTKPRSRARASNIYRVKTRA
jgi:hypothetical protein